MMDEEASQALRLIRKCGTDLSSVTRYVRSLPSPTVDHLLSIIRDSPKYAVVCELSRALCTDENITARAIAALGIALERFYGGERDALLGIVSAIMGTLVRKDEEGETFCLPDDVIQTVMREGVGKGSGVVEALSECIRVMPGNFKGKVWTLLVVRGVREGWWGGKGGGWRELLAVLGMRLTLGKQGEEWTREMVTSVCRKRSGGIEAVELVGRIVERMERNSAWAEVLRWIVSDIPPPFFADVLCVIELKMADGGLVVLELLKEYEKILQTSRIQEHACAGEKGSGIGCTDVALLMSILAHCSDESLETRAFRCLTTIFSASPSVLNVVNIASGSSSALQPDFPRFSLFQGFLRLPGMKQRVVTVVDFCEKLIWTNDQFLIRWGIKLLNECFTHFENVRSEIIDRALSAMLEQECFIKVRKGYWQLIELLTTRPQLHFLGAHCSAFSQWLPFVSLMPLSFAICLTKSLSRLASAYPLFLDKFVTWLRKLASGKTYVGHEIGATGLCALLDLFSEDNRPCDDILTSLLELIDSSSIPLRAQILDRVRPLLNKHIRLRNAITSRLARIADGQLHLNSCIKIDEETVRLVDAVPALVRCLVVVHNVDAFEEAQNSYRATREPLRSLVEYVANPGSALFHAIHNDRDLEEKVAIYASVVKLDLLLSLCEALFETAKICGKFDGVIRMYAITVIVRDGLRKRLKQIGGSLEHSEASFTTRKDLMTAREASSVELHESEAMRKLAQSPISFVEGKEVLVVLHSVNESVVVRCAAAIEAFEKVSSPERLASRTRSEIVNACIRLLRDTHPWVQARGKRLSPGADGKEQDLLKKEPRASGPQYTESSPCSFQRSSIRDSKNMPQQRRQPRNLGARGQEWSTAEPTDSSGVVASLANIDLSVSDLETEREPSGISVAENRRRNAKTHIKSNSVNVSCISAPTREEENDHGQCFRRAALFLTEMFRSRVSSDCSLKIAGLAISSLLPTKADHLSACVGSRNEEPTSSLNKTRSSSVSSSSSVTSVTPASSNIFPSFPHKLSGLLDRDAIVCSTRSKILQILEDFRGDIPLKSKSWASLQDREDQSTNDSSADLTYAPILGCLKKEFEHSMSLPLALRYVHFLSSLVADAEKDGKTEGFEDLSGTICEILNCFEVRHVTLLRSFMEILLRTLSTGSCDSLILAIGAMVSYPSLTEGGSDEEDISLDARSFPSDLLRVGLIMDGLLPGKDVSTVFNPTEGGAVQQKMKDDSKEDEKEDLVIKKAVIRSWTEDLGKAVLNSVIWFLHRSLLAPTAAKLRVATKFLQALYDAEACDVSRIFVQAGVQSLVTRIFIEGRKALSRKNNQDDRDIANVCCSFACGNVAKVCVANNPRLCLSQEVLAMEQTHKEDHRASGKEGTRPGALVPHKRYRGRRRGRQARVLRSRNKVIDDWLAKDSVGYRDETYDDDDYADMEDFIVDIEDDDG